jgi:D-alanyl-D-alanine dipeptidase
MKSFHLLFPVTLLSILFFSFIVSAEQHSSGRIIDITILGDNDEVRFKTTNMPAGVTCFCATPINNGTYPYGVTYKGSPDMLKRILAILFAAQSNGNNLDVWSEMDSRGMGVVTAAKCYVAIITP